jgi:hypothetical protein
MRLEDYVQHDLKVKSNTGKSKLKVGMNGNGLLSTPEMRNSCDEEE